MFRIHRYCERCKLEQLKQCTPDSIDGICCNRVGTFARGTRAIGLIACSQHPTMPGYCKSGKCLTYLQFFKDGSYSFAAPAKEFVCTAKCEGFLTTNVCYNSGQFPRSGRRLLLPNGAICLMSGIKSECDDGPCSTFDFFNPLKPSDVDIFTKFDSFSGKRLRGDFAGGTGADVEIRVWPASSHTRTTIATHSVTATGTTTITTTSISQNAVVNLVPTICRPGFKLTTECVPCGAATVYCVHGVAKEVSPGYYSIGGTSTTRTGQTECGGNAFYCANGVRKRASRTEYTTGGTALTRTGVKKCKTIQHCTAEETCQWPNNQKCSRCDDSHKLVKGKSDKCVAKNDDGFDNEGESSSGSCVVTSGVMYTYNTCGKTSST